MINVTPVILCGGSGTRLWPLSRAGLSKHFFGAVGDNMFAPAGRRLPRPANMSLEIFYVQLSSYLGE